MVYKNVLDSRNKSENDGNWTLESSPRVTKRKIFVKKPDYDESERTSNYNIVFSTFTWSFA